MMSTPNAVEWHTISRGLNHFTLGVDEAGAAPFAKQIASFGLPTTEVGNCFTYQGPVLPCKARGFGSPMCQHSGRTKVSKPSGAELLCSQVVHG